MRGPRRSAGELAQWLETESSLTGRLSTEPAERPLHHELQPNSVVITATRRGPRTSFAGWRLSLVGRLTIRGPISTKTSRLVPSQPGCGLGGVREFYAGGGSPASEHYRSCDDTGDRRGLGRPDWFKGFSCNKTAKNGRRPDGSGPVNGHLNPRPRELQTPVAVPPAPRDQLEQEAGTCATQSDSRRRTILRELEPCWWSYSDSMNSRPPVDEERKIADFVADAASVGIVENPCPGSLFQAAGQSSHAGSASAA